MKKFNFSSALFLLFFLTFFRSSFCIYPKHPITEYCETREPILSFLQSLVEILIEVEADNDDTQLQLNTIISIRMYLENNDNCPDDEILQNDMVSILVKCIDSENLEIKKEVTNALGIFANGTEKQANMVIQYNAIPHFLSLLSSDNEELQRAAILAFMGIMGHGPKFRDYCIKTGLVEPVVNLVQDSESSIDVLYDCAVMMYYICQEGKPIVPHDTVVKILPALKTLIELKSDNEKIDGILISAIGSLGFIGKSGFNRIRLIVDKNFVEKIVPFLQHSHSDVQKMTIFALNKIMDGNSTYHQHVLDHDVLKYLHILLSHSTDDDIIKEALEFLIHVIAPNNSHINDVFKESNLMPLVIKAFDIKKLQIQITATEVILVTSVRGSVEQIEYLIENGIAAAICKHMKVLRFERFEGAEENVLNALLHIVKKGKEKLTIMFNELEKCGGIDILEELKKSNDFNVRFMSGNIVNAILSAVTKNHMEL